MSAPAALAGLRVVDLTDAHGQYCGKLFADLGADVILVEPSGGSSARRRGPFVGGDAGEGASIPFFYDNTNKRSIVADLDDEGGRAVLRELIASADLLIDTAAPGALAARGLDHDALRRLRPSLVQVSITPFGQDGPYARHAADDLTLLAMGGLAQLGGYPDGPPQAAYGEQAHHAACVFAAVAGLAAVLAAEQTGRGEFIDVSAQESVVMALENAAQFYDLERSVRPRAAGHRVIGGQMPCGDGYVYVMAGGVSGQKSWANVVGWLVAEGAAEAETLLAPEWSKGSFRNTPEAKAEFLRIFSGWSMTRTRAEIEASARVHRIPMAPVGTPADVLANRQLAHRGFFVAIDDPASGRSVTMPGAPYHLAATPWRIDHAAPAIDADRDLILSELRPCPTA